MRSDDRTANSNPRCTMPWIVKLVKTPTQNDFRSGFFPRKVYYKKDAQELVREVESKGGKAEVVKDSK